MICPLGRGDEEIPRCWGGARGSRRWTASPAPTAGTVPPAGAARLGRRPPGHRPGGRVGDLPVSRRVLDTHGEDAAVTVDVLLVESVLELHCRIRTDAAAKVARRGREQSRCAVRADP